MTTGKRACGVWQAEIGCLGFGDVTRLIFARAISRSSQTMSKDSRPEGLRYVRTQADAN